ncbi:Hypothetical_protein [Hexamita inflata]|uniref:Hypothetical_protein n=1 Tax=Hexamita inflata TaxID=28002 RepID=A0AA86PZB7_9EUKA|nr:Hypothetical protein HINF_LOCUS31267 [Hexamita inflata]
MEDAMLCVLNVTLTDSIIKQGFVSFRSSDSQNELFSWYKIQARSLLCYDRAKSLAYYVYMNDNEQVNLTTNNYEIFNNRHFNEVVCVIVYHADNNQIKYYVFTTSTRVHQTERYVGAYLFINRHVYMFTSEHAHNN